MKRLHAFVVEHEFEIQVLVACLIVLGVLGYCLSGVMQVYSQVKR
jgi:hypothetical protein